MGPPEVSRIEPVESIIFVRCEFVLCVYSHVYVYVYVSRLSLLASCLVSRVIGQLGQRNDINKIYDDTIECYPTIDKNVVTIEAAAAAEEAFGQVRHESNGAPNVVWGRISAN